MNVQKKNKLRLQIIKIELQRLWISHLQYFIKRFRESREISVRKWQGWTSVLDVHDHLAFRQHCIKNRHDAVISNGMRQSGKLFCVQMITNLKLSLENMEGAPSELQIQLVISTEFKSLHLWWYGGALVPIKLAAYKSGKTLSMLKSIYRF